MTRLFFYYALHSFKNQIKKIFRSWVIIFIAVCILLGALVGIGVGLFADRIAEGNTPAQEEVAKDSEPDDVPFNEEQICALVCLIASGLTLSMLFFSCITADKDGSKLFLMADVNLLFSAPMKPQSVLLFRLLSQILVSVFASIYLLAQIPNLVINLGVPLVSAFALLVAWVGFLIFGKLINVFIYTVTSTYTSLKRYIRPACYGCMLILGAAFLAFYKTGDKNLLDAADAFWNAKWTFWIPIYGWIKGVIYWSWVGNQLNFVITLVLMLAGIIGLSYLVWNIKADFYEDALSKAQEIADTLAAAQAGGTVKRKKDRSEKIARDGLTRGSGASVFFWKSVYNRFRFSYGKVLTKTSGTYLTLSLLECALMLFAIKQNFFPAIGFGACVLVFFRSLGNPLAKDVGMPYFTTIPENPWKKVMYSVLGGSLDCFLDVAPSMIVSGILLRANFGDVIAFTLFALCVDFYAENVMLFIELSLPSSLSLQTKQMVSILFIYFGLAPIAAAIAFGWLLLGLRAGVFLACAVSVFLGGIFFAFSPMFLQYGRK